MSFRPNASDTMPPLTRQQIQRVRLYLVLAPALVLIWIPFDYLLEEILFTRFLGLRIAFAAVAFSLLALMSLKPSISQHHTAIALAVYGLLIGSIFPMVFATEAFYPYLLGFMCVFMGTATVLIWSPGYIAVPGLLAWAIGIWIGFDGPDARIKAITYNFVLGTTLTISVTSAWFTFRSAVANSRLTTELERLTATDTLTDAANRRRFDHHLQQEWKRAARDNTPLSLILCDVDHFKAYNDHYGHQMGDRCLQQVVRAMHAAATRPGDLVARYGGEEFALVLPHTASHGAVHVARKVCKNVSALHIPHARSSASPNVTISAGIATVWPARGGSPDELIAQADQQLYQAKKQGRNRWSICDDMRWNHEGSRQAHSAATCGETAKEPLLP